MRYMRAVIGIEPCDNSDSHNNDNDDDTDTDSDSEDSDDSDSDSEMVGDGIVALQVTDLMLIVSYHHERH